MADKQDLAPEKVRLKDNYRERIFAESQKLDKSYLDTLYFIVDCYFVFIKAGLPAQLVTNTPINTESNQLPSKTSTPVIEEGSGKYVVKLDIYHYPPVNGYNLSLTLLK